MQRNTFALLTTPVLLTVIAGCGGTAGGDSGAGYPVTIKNCGTDVEFEQAPERVVLLEPAPVTALDKLGVLDRVVSRAGEFSSEYYSDKLNKKIDDIPVMSDDLDASGHLALSQEEVIAEDPDLVMGLPDGMTREGLSGAGANTLTQSTYCPESVEPKPTTFDTLYDQIEDYGKVFDRRDKADDLVGSLKDRVKKVTDDTKDSKKRTAAVLYPEVGGGPLSTYGSASMAQPQLEAAGFTNVFEDSKERVFEVSGEELIDRDPDVLILLGQEKLDKLPKEVESLPGAGSMRALKNDNVMVQRFNFTEPPSPLAVDGLERIVDRFGTGE